MTAYIIDTETTNADRETAEVVELATQTFRFGAEVGLPSNFITRGEVETARYKPTNVISFGALSTHHILPEDLNDCLPSSHAALPPDCSYIIGHNIDFDWAVLGSPPVRRICTLAMARAVWPQLDSHKLGALVYAVNGVSAGTKAYLQDAHSAGADVLYCNTVLNGLLQTKPHIATVEQLWHFSEECRIPTVMTFGKYKGEPVEKVDRGWIAWYRKQKDLDPYLLEAFQRLGK